MNYKLNYRLLLTTFIVTCALAPLFGCSTRAPLPVAAHHPADSQAPCESLVDEHVRTTHESQRLHFHATNGWPHPIEAVQALEAEAYRQRAASLALTYASRCGGPIPPVEPYVHTFPEGYFDDLDVAMHRPEGTGYVESQFDGEQDRPAPRGTDEPPDENDPAKDVQ